MITKITIIKINNVIVPYNVDAYLIQELRIFLLYISPSSNCQFDLPRELLNIYDSDFGSSTNLYVSYVV